MIARLARAALALLALALAASPATAQSAPDPRARLIVITDIGTEPDDMQSLVRLLTYANEISIEALIAAPSRHLPDETGGHLIRERIAAYGEVLGNLRRHDPAYPDAETLLARVFDAPPLLGMSGVGAGHDSAASQAIIAAMDRDDPRPLHIAIWGGAQPLAQALWHLRETRSPAQVEQLLARLRVYSISDQDDAGPWARGAFPGLFWIASVHGPLQYPLAAWTGISAAVDGADRAFVSPQWLDRNVRRLGALGEVYPRVMFIMEGDTPSFLNLARNGLSNPERPDWGGWGGRYLRVGTGGLWSDAIDTVRGAHGRTVSSNQATVWRWRSAFQNDFAARMAWSVTPDVAAANHHPVPVLNDIGGLAALRLRACPGSGVVLSASGSSDPDGDALSFGWMHYREPTGPYAPPVSLSHDNGPTITVSVPRWVQPDAVPLPAELELHILLTVVDNGTPQLTRYRRAIIAVPTGGGHDDAGLACEPVEQAPHQRLPQATREVFLANDAHFSTGHSQLGELVDDPGARAVLEAHLPGLAARLDANPQGRGMTIAAIRSADRRITDAVLAAIDADLAALSPAPSPQR